ncbi:MAG: DNA primase [Burkholderiales bacterium]|nr:MAG: DNA primase [Burkholderiales bacterium]
MIPDDFIQQLLSRVDIVEVIDRQVPLKKAGANYSACCPFHKEKSPSFTVSPAKQFYHCFGCGAHGSAIKFLMEYSGKSFPDAVEELAQNIGLTVPRDESKKADPLAGPLFDAMITAANFYKSKLKSAPVAIEYFKRRGVSGEIAKRFHLGWSPLDWQGLSEAFDDYAENELLITGGLVKLGDGGRRYDTFRERVIFPILSQQGAVIGFGGRILGGKDDAGPKYLNSPETPIFSKGRELYGLFQAQGAIRKANRVLVVEGYMDVIALVQFGVEYVVATLGTATTEAHTQRLLRLADEVVFSFDGDSAGQRAAWRALENALPALRDGKQVRFLFLPTEHDPDSYIREHGREAFEKFIDSALPLSRYWLRELNARHPGDSAEAKAARASAAREHLEVVSAPMLRESLAKALEADVNIASYTLLPPVKPRVAPERQSVRSDRGDEGFDVGAPIRDAYRRDSRAFGRRPPMPPTARNDPATQRILAASRRILARPKLAMHLVDLPPIEATTSPRALRLLHAVVDVAIRLPDEPNHGAVLEQFRDSEFANDIAQLLTHRDHELDALLNDEEIEAELRVLREKIVNGSLLPSSRAIDVPSHLGGAGILALTPRRNDPGERSNSLSPGGAELGEKDFVPPRKHQSMAADRHNDLTNHEKENGNRIPDSRLNPVPPLRDAPPPQARGNKNDDNIDDIPFEMGSHFAPPPDEDHPPF